MTTTVSIADVYDINPSDAFSARDEDIFTFAPMEAVDEQTATIARRLTRPFGEVRKGYTSFAERDVLIAKITPCMENGKCAIAKRLHGGRGFGSTEFHVLRAGDRVIPEWVYYFWRRPESRAIAARAMTGTAGQRRVPESVFEDIEIPLPDVPTQRRIADTLKRADRLQNVRRSSIDFSVHILPGAFNGIFGDPIRNPHEYPLVVLGELLAAPPSLGTTQPCSPDGTFRCVRVGEIGGSEIDLASCASVSLSDGETDRYRVYPGDILLARAIGSEDHLGKLSICQSISEPLVFDSHCMRVRVDPNRLSNLYLATLLRLPSGRSLFFREARRTAVQFNINCEQLSNIVLPVPPLPLQSDFSDIVHKRERIRAAHHEAIRQADHLFQTLLHRAFTGGLN